MTNTVLNALLIKYADNFSPIIRYDPIKGKIALLDLSESNTRLSESVYSDTGVFDKFINNTRKEFKADYLIGGYCEKRQMYQRSRLFDNNLHPIESHFAEPRCLHLGTDIWADAGTEVFAPLKGRVHSFAFNNNFGDYGATIILEHQLESYKFHTLYGHLSLVDIDKLEVNQEIPGGGLIAHFGIPEENGYWPPHLHFQIIVDMQEYKGDFPGVCTLSDAEIFKINCPDPDQIIRLNRYLQ